MLSTGISEEEPQLQFHVKIHHDEPIHMAVLAEIISIMYTSAESVTHDWIDRILPSDIATTSSARFLLHEAVKQHYAELLWLESVAPGSSNFKGNFRNWMCGAFGALAVLTGHKMVEMTIEKSHIAQQLTTDAAYRLDHTASRLKEIFRDHHEQRGGSTKVGFTYEMKVLNYSVIKIDVYPNQTSNPAQHTKRKAAK